MDLIARKKALLIAQEGFIPPGYQKYDWLSTYGQNTRIDTGITGNDDTLKIHCKFMPIDLKNNYAPLFNNYQSENDHYCWRCILKATTATDFETSLYVTLGNNSAGGGGTISIYPTNGESIVGKLITIDMEYGSCTMTGTRTQTATRPYASKTVNTNNITIGAANASSTSGGSTIWRIYDFKMWSHGRLVRNYYPVVRKSDNKPGFYDTVNHTFSPSIGGGDFVAGND